MSGSAAKTLSVLLVEDSLADGRLLLEALRPAVYAGEILVQTVKRLSLAIEELQRFDFSCVLLDLGLPDGRGVENVSALRAIDQRPAIVVLTALDDEAVAAQALKLGAQDYVLKGQTDADHLLKLIRRAVQRNRQNLQMESQRDSGFIAATRDPATLLPNLPLLLDRARQQQAEARAAGHAFGIGVLLLEGLDRLREQLGVSHAEQHLREIADTLVESLGAADTLARVAPQALVLLPRPWLDAAALTEKLQRLAAAIEPLTTGLGQSVSLKPRLACAWLRADHQTIEQLLAEGLQAAANAEVSQTATTGSPNAAPLVKNSHPALWRPWLDVNTGRCAGATLSAEAGAASVVVALEALIVFRHQLADAGLPLPLPDTLALALSSEAVQDHELAIQLKKVLENHGIAPRDIALGIPLAAMAAGHAEISALHSAGFQLVLDCGQGGEPTFAELSQWPFQSLLLQAGQWQRVLEDNLRGPRRRGFTALLGAAQALGIRVIACDVDEDTARDSLRLVGVRCMQGEALMAASSAGELAGRWQLAQAMQR